MLGRWRFRWIGTLGSRLFRGRESHPQVEQSEVLPLCRNGGAQLPVLHLEQLPSCREQGKVSLPKSIGHQSRTVQVQESDVKLAGARQRFKFSGFLVVPQMGVQVVLQRVQDSPRAPLVLFVWEKIPFVEVTSAAAVDKVLIPIVPVR